MGTKRNRPGVFFGVYLILIVLCVLGLLGAGEELMHFTTGVVRDAAQATPLDKAQALAVHNGHALPAKSEIKYRKFFITAPRAGKVELRGDFNQWGAQPLELKTTRPDYFEITLALSDGEYRYVFVVDGKEILDPANTDCRTLSSGRDVCVKTVR